MMHVRALFSCSVAMATGDTSAKLTNRIAEKSCNTFPARLVQANKYQVLQPNGKLINIIRMLLGGYLS